MIDELEQYDFVDTDFMDENSYKFSTLIGQYLIEFSYFEHGINILVADLINDRSHDMGYIVTAKMSMANKIDLLERIGELGKFQRVPEFKRILPAISMMREVNKFRNQIAHANWATMKPGGVVRVKVKVDRDRGVWFQNINLGDSKITQELEKLKEVSQKVYNLHI